MAADSFPVVTGDFNGDGAEDYAVGAPSEDVEGVEHAGQVTIHYGAGALATYYALTQGTLGIPGIPEHGDGFGASLAVGDFDQDGNADLAIGTPGEDLGSHEPIEDAGVVIIVYGSSSGLNAGKAAQWIRQGRDGIPSIAEAGDRFGASLAVGDFDEDGNADLAIGTPSENVGSYDQIVDAGAVVIVYGSSSGLNAGKAAQWIRQGRDGIPSIAEAGDRFGASLAVGDFDQDGNADLAIGTPSENVGSYDQIVDAGAVVIVYGSSSGLNAGKAAQWITQRRDDIPSIAEAGDHFGEVLAVGDFDHDGNVDLAIGTPGENLGSHDQIADAGAVIIVYGSRSGLNAGKAAEWITQWGDDIPSIAEAGDRFGASLAAGDFDHDGNVDLAIGTPGENLGSHDQIADAGAVIIVYGSRSGLNAGKAAEWITQWGDDIPSIAEAGDRFGASLAAGDFEGGDGKADLLIASPGETPGNLDRTPNLGTVTLVFGGGSGLNSDRHAIDAVEWSAEWGKWLQ